MSPEQVDIAPGEYTYLPIERVHFGQGVIDKLGSELDRIGSQRPFVITGHTIANKTDLVVRLEQVARRKLAGVFSEIRQHAPESGIKLAAKAAREARADSLVSLGGGSPIDATKIVVKEISENFRHSSLPHLAIPTTLSAAEFSHAAGMTDEKLPSWLWASTGIRSLDHAVEAVCSPRHQPYVDVLALEAIRLLFQNLKRSLQEPIDLRFRLACQIAAWLSDAGALSVGTGISHAIGRVIGATWNIPHGITSCLTLAEVMRMEAKRYPKQPTEGRPEEVAMSAAEGVAELVRELDLSKRLRDYGIEKSDFSTIVRDAGSPEQSADIIGILEKIW